MLFGPDLSPDEDPTLLKLEGAKVYLRASAHQFSLSLNILPSYEGFLGLGRCLSLLPPEVKIPCRFPQLSDYTIFKHNYPTYQYKDYIECSREEFIANLFRQALMCQKIKGKPDSNEALWALTQSIAQGVPILPQDLVEGGKQFDGQDPSTIDRAVLVEALQRKLFSYRSFCEESKMPPATVDSIGMRPAPVLTSQSSLVRSIESDAATKKHTL